MLLADGFSDAFTGVSVSFIMFGLPAILWFASRYLKHRERMAAYQAGFDPSRYGAPAPGPGPVYPPPPQAQQRAERRWERDKQHQTPERQVASGIRTTAIGLALTIGLSFIGVRDGGFEPGPWLLGGLVPLFVGLSQIMNGVISGAAIPFFGGTFSPPGSAPPPPPSPSAPGTPGPDGGRVYDTYSYTYRPGAPEIEQPPRPPERRN